MEKRDDFRHKPMVSIITVVYNGDKHLKQTIESVINQSYQNVEYIMIDGGSTDSTLDIIEKYKNKIDYFISEPDDGIYDAMNKGIGNASGELIGIVNSDDWYEPNTVETVADIYHKKAYGVIYGLARVFENNKQRKIFTNHYQMLPVTMMTHQTCFIQRKIYEKYGNYSLKYKWASDYDLLLRLYSQNVSFFQLETILTNFRYGGATTQFDLKTHIEKLKIQYDHGYLSRCKMTKGLLVLKIRQYIQYLKQNFGKKAMI